MIGKLRGKIDSIFHDHIIIDIGGVGYRVFCSGKTLNKFTIGEEVSILIETHVREDHIQLFGFQNPFEKQLFLLLTTVKGVGTRVALSILSAFSPEQISNFITTNDKAAHKALPGVGAKIWERIIIELKDKVVGIVSYSNKDIIQNQEYSKIPETSLIQDSISALGNLGINKAEAFRVVNDITAREPGINIKDLIKKSLQQFAK